MARVVPRLELGDIVVYHGTSWSARLIQLVTRSYWNHAAIVVGRLATGQYTVLEASFPRARLWPLNLESDIEVYRVTESYTKQQKIARAAIALHQKPYDVLVALRVIRKCGIKKSLRILLRSPLTVPKIAGSELVCSELVQEAYSNAGIPLNSDNILLLPGDIPNIDNTYRVF